MDTDLTPLHPHLAIWCMPVTPGLILVTAARAGVGWQDLHDANVAECERDPTHTGSQPGLLCAKYIQGLREYQERNHLE